MAQIAPTTVVELAGKAVFADPTNADARQVQAASSNSASRSYVFGTSILATTINLVVGIVTG